MITQTNRLAIFVASAILTQPTIRSRRKVLSKMITLCHELVRLRNYHSAFGVMAGIKTQSVQRLWYTFKDLSSSSMQRYTHLSSLLTGEDDFRQYRSALATAEIPAIPFMGMFLVDLFNTEAQHRSNVMTKASLGQIDWTSREELAKKVLSEFVNFQREAIYPFKFNQLLATSVINCIDDYQRSPAQLHQLSVDIEPPNTLPKEKFDKKAIFNRVFEVLADLW